MSITASVPGKLMLLGEHAVVYGYPCIVTAVDKYLSVTVRKTDKNHEEIITPGVTDQSFVKGAIRIFKEKFAGKKSVYLTTKSELGNLGLGSSAAVTCATIKSLANLYQVKLTSEDLFNLAYKVILKVQGRASGFDIAASIYGGTIYFDGKTKKTKLLSKRELPLVVAFTGRKGNTREMIKKVYDLRKKKPEYVEQIFKDITQLVKVGKEAVKTKNWEKLGFLMDKNQTLLERLHITTPEIDNLILAVKHSGAYGVKISGAGGGDCIIAMTQINKLEGIKQAIVDAGGKVVKIKVGVGKGVR